MTQILERSIVVIGASNGGLEALIEIVGGLAMICLPLCFSSLVSPQIQRVNFLKFSLAPATSQRLTLETGNRSNIAAFMSRLPVSTSYYYVMDRQRWCGGLRRTIIDLPLIRYFDRRHKP